MKLIIQKYWHGKGGIKELLILSFPLILSTGAHSIQHFVDRVFLTWYSPEAIAAAMPAAMLNFAPMCIFLGTAGYSSTFVAQYFGSKNYKMIGPVIWQGIYLAIIGAIFHFSLIPFADEIFNLIGHPEKVIQNEIIYFRIICFSAFPVIAASALAGFFSGRSRPWAIMWIHSITTVINIVLDYTLIFGNFGFPAMGIKGAAIATVIATCFPFVTLLILFCLPKHESKFKSLSNWKFNPKLFARIIRFGFPNGFQFFLDIAGFSIFVFMIGRLGIIELAASNIALNINNLIFLPMIGLGIAVSVSVGQYIGKNDPLTAQRSTYSGFIITFIYMIPAALSFVLLPEIYISLFSSNSNSDELIKISEITTILLKFVAIYSIFDVFNIIFSASIKGAGDTKFVMIFILTTALIILVIPVFFVIFIWNLGIFFAWGILTFYIFILGLGFYLRFKTGKWQKMSVIR